MLTSAQNPRIKLVQTLLGRARSRRKQGLVVLEGLRLVADAISQGHRPEFVLHTATITPPGGTEAIAIDPSLMRHISDTQQPQGLLAVFPMPQAELPASAELLLILDGIRDPGNLGTILRAAAAAGADGVLLAPGCVDVWNPKTLRAGMGAHFRVPLAECDLAQLEQHAAQLPLILADSDGEQPYDAFDWTTPCALVIGGEARGADEPLRQLAQASVRIPMASADYSLNAAMATSVLLFEAQRQRYSSLG